jgi:aerobic-type carbon monoxide dehydrogenase small subunit (CoxS/CutS family)
VRKERATFVVNGREYEELVPANMTLLELLRDRLGLTGTKRGCSASGNCGACTVLVEGKPVLSCLMLAWMARGRSILTVEGLSERGRLHPLQQAFLDVGAVQCGFCTPGMLLSAKALLDTHPDPTEQEVRQALAGNLCRCTGYVKIVEAVLAAAAVIRGESSFGSEHGTIGVKEEGAGLTNECVSW